MGEHEYQLELQISTRVSEVPSEFFLRKMDPEEPRNTHTLTCGKREICAAQEVGHGSYENEPLRAPAAGGVIDKWSQVLCSGSTMVLEQKLCFPQAGPRQQLRQQKYEDGPIPVRRRPL